MTIVELTSNINNHISNKSNPHKVTSKQIWGLDKVDNTSDTNRGVNQIMQVELDKKMNLSELYNSTTNDVTKDLTKLAWTASQGYQMNNIINSYQAQDTTDINNRISALEDNI